MCHKRALENIHRSKFKVVNEDSIGVHTKIFGRLLMVVKRGELGGNRGGISVPPKNALKIFRFISCDYHGFFTQHPF